MAITDALPDMQRVLEFYPADVTKASRFGRDEVQRFNEEGYLCPIDILSGDEVDRTRTYFESLMELAQDAGLNSYSING